MAKASVVGTFLHETTGDVHTVMRFATSTGEELFVTDDLNYVEPCTNGVHFVTEKGEFLLAQRDSIFV